MVPITSSTGDFAVYYALKNVDKARDTLEADQRRREVARDLISQGPREQIHLSEGARSGIKKMKSAVKAIRGFRSAAAEGAMAAGNVEAAKRFDPLKMQEEKNKARLRAAQSAPSLITKQPTPRGEVKHVENWTGPDRTRPGFYQGDVARELGFRPWGSTGQRRPEGPAGALAAPSPPAPAPSSFRPPPPPEAPQQVLGPNFGHRYSEDS
eukprot:s795_g12.t1